jgi:hypothetical protein
LRCGATVLLPFFEGAGAAAEAFDGAGFFLSDGLVSVLEAMMTLE